VAEGLVVAFAGPKSAAGPVATDFSDLMGAFRHKQTCEADSIMAGKSVPADKRSTLGTSIFRRLHARQFTRIQSQSSFIVLIAVALLLSFGRNGMLPFTGTTTRLDLALNLLVVLLAPLCALCELRWHELLNYFGRMLPILSLAAWVFFCLLFNTPPEYWPDRSSVISLALALFLASRVSLRQLRALRFALLLIAFLFCVSATTLARADLSILFRLVFYSKIEVRLKKLQKQAIFGGVIFKASICSAKY